MHIQSDRALHRRPPLGGRAASRVAVPSGASARWTRARGIEHDRSTQLGRQRVHRALHFSRTHARIYRPAWPFTADSPRRPGGACRSAGRRIAVNDHILAVERLCLPGQCACAASPSGPSALPPRATFPARSSAHDTRQKRAVGRDDFVRSAGSTPSARASRATGSTRPAVARVECGGADSPGAALAAGTALATASPRIHDGQRLRVVGDDAEDRSPRGLDVQSNLLAWRDRLPVYQRCAKRPDACRLGTAQLREVDVVTALDAEVVASDVRDRDTIRRLVL